MFLMMGHGENEERGWFLTRVLYVVLLSKGTTSSNSNASRYQKIKKDSPKPPLGRETKGGKAILGFDDQDLGQFNFIHPTQHDLDPRKTARVSKLVWPESWSQRDPLVYWAFAPQAIHFVSRPFLRTNVLSLHKSHKSLN
jgi:hypothetical protein